MSAEAKQTFPTIPLTSWWALREVFARAMPTATVSPQYLGTVLSMNPTSARKNVLPGLRATGLVDNDDKATPRANRWRDDDEYPAVCAEIRAELYPEELLIAYPGPEVDRQRLERWFQQRTGAGTNAAAKMAMLFELLAAADPSQQTSTRQRTSSTPRSGSRAPARDKKAKPATLAQQTGGIAPAVDATINRRPSLHIDIQIHISPESTTTQIDQIFKSMAKHLNLSDSQDVD